MFLQRQHNIMMDLYHEHEGSCFSGLLPLIHQYERRITKVENILRKKEQYHVFISEVSDRINSEFWNLPKTSPRIDIYYEMLQDVWLEIRQAKKECDQEQNYLKFLKRQVKEIKAEVKPRGC